MWSRIPPSPPKFVDTRTTEQKVFDLQRHVLLEAARGGVSDPTQLLRWAKAIVEAREATNGKA